MPDSTTNLEMRDVLSSIRRLVSDEREPATATATATARPDKFILTPAHRVHDAAPREDEVLPAFVRDTGTAASGGPEPRRAVADEAPFVPSPRPAPRSSNARQSLEARIAELEAAVSRANDEWEPDGSEPEAAEAPPRHIFRVVDNDRFKASPESGPEEDSADAGPLKLADVAIFTHVPRRFGPEPGDDAAADPQPAAAEEPVVEKQATEEPVTEAPAAAPQEPPAEAETPEIAAAFLGEVDDSAWPPAAHVEAAEETAAPAAAPADDDAPALAEVAAAEDAPPAETVQVPEIVSAGGELVEGDEHVFVDEDVLRRVVADVVREELQGKLGERITRNVRKMVRREIEQTLALRDFD